MFHAFVVAYALALCIWFTIAIALLFLVVALDQDYADHRLRKAWAGLLFICLVTLFGLVLMTIRLLS